MSGGPKRRWSWSSVAESRQAIMQSIAENAGSHTDAKTMVFSMPVSDVRGLADN